MSVFNTFQKFYPYLKNDGEEISFTQDLITGFLRFFTGIARIEYKGVKAISVPNDHRNEDISIVQWLTGGDISKIGDISVMLLDIHGMITSQLGGPSRDEDKLGHLNLFYVGQEHFGEREYFFEDLYGFSVESRRFTARAVYLNWDIKSKRWIIGALPIDHSMNFRPEPDLKVFVPKNFKRLESSGV